MEGQQHLGQTAIDAVVVNIGYRFGHGYDVTVQHRRNGQRWQDAERRVYDYLTGPEAAQVVCEELDRLLG